MGRNPFKDRPEESKNRELLRIGQRVLIVEKHKQGCDREGLTEVYINGFLTGKPFHPQGVKVSGIRATYIDGKDIIWKDANGEMQGDIELIKQIGKVGTKAGDLDLNKHAIGRVQYLLENHMNIEPGDLVVIAKSKKQVLERDKVEGIVMDIIQYEIVDGEQKTQVRLVDDTIGWVHEVLMKI